MVSCFRFCVVLIPLILSIATIILGAIAIAGQTKNSTPVENIYMFRLDLTNITSSVSSVLGSSTDLSSSKLSDVYTFGMWGYCQGSGSSSDYTVTACSDPKAMYIFDPVDFLENILGSSEVTLPSQIQSYISTAKIVSKIIFITGIIGVCCAFLAAVFTVVSFCSHLLSCLAMITGIISFLSTAICAGASTGAFMLVKKYFNDAVDTYGISGSLGNHWFYGFIWGSAVAALFCAVLNFFAICCGRTASRRRSIESEPMMVYHEKSHSDSD